MKSIILKGFHRPITLIPPFLRDFGFICEDYEKECEIRFTESCRYDLGNEHQSSWNKLFGFCFGILGIHRDSYRFGWRYNTKTGMIEISRLMYYNKDHIMEKLCDLEIGKSYDLVIGYKTKTLGLEVYWEIYEEDDEEICSDSLDIEIPDSKFRFGCSLYFGGQKPAPHKIEIENDR